MLANENSFDILMELWVKWDNQIKLNKPYFYGAIDKIKCTVLEKYNFYQFKCVKEDGTICCVHCEELYDIKHINKNGIELLKIKFK